MSMGFRFRRSIRLLPGVTLNIGKRGVSTSFGIRGARITRGHGKTRVTLGVPGTGLSHTSVGGRSVKSAPRGTSSRIGTIFIYAVVGVVVFLLVYSAMR